MNALHRAKIAYERAAPRLRHALGLPRRVLLYVPSDTMLPHLLRYHESVRELPGYRFYSLCEDESSAKALAERGVAPCPRYARRAWDLIVAADMKTPAGVSKQMTPLLYVNHGLHIVSQDGGETLYCYGPLALDEAGAPKFTRMCEPNARIAERMRALDPAMGAVIEPTGFKFAGDIDAALEKRAETRAALGVDKSACLVGFFGTWKEHSLFHALGPGLFDACASLRGAGYQFLFSIHPNEYRRYDPAIEPMGPLVDRQRERGMLVRSPGEPFEPYLAACDIVVSDYSSMAESALIARRKLNFSPYPDGKEWKHSLTAEARRALPTLTDASALVRTLSATRYSPLDPFIPNARKLLVRDDHDAVMRELTLRLARKGGSGA